MARDPATTGPLVGTGDIVQTLGRIARQEWRFAKAEMSQNLGRAGRGVGMLVGAFATGLVAVFVLAGAAVAGLATTGMALWLAAVIVGGTLALIAAICVAIGLSQLKSDRLIPDRTLANIQRDMAIVNEALHG